MQISVKSKATGAVQSVQNGQVTLRGASIVTVAANPADVASYGREGSDLIIRLRSGGTVRIRNFFGKDGNDPSDLQFVDGTGAVTQASLPAELGGAGGVAEGGGSSDISPLAILGGLAAAGGAVALASSGGGGGGGGFVPPPAQPPGLLISTQK